jgi:amino-acid N-acetyltransferase
MLWTGLLRGEMMTIRSLSPVEEQAAVALLRECRLPTEDLAEARPHFLGEKVNDDLSGVVAVELHGHAGLLRSLAVRPDRRSTGLGTRLADEAERWARLQGVSRLYILTTTAEKFFARRGYVAQKREDADPAIRGTTEFTSACPASAVVMYRTLP